MKIMLAVALLLSIAAAPACSFEKSSATESSQTRSQTPMTG